MISFENKSVLIFDLDYTIVKLKADWHGLRNELNRRYTQIFGEVRNFKTMSACLSSLVEKKDWEHLEEFLQIIQRYELENIEDTSLIEETIFFINNKVRFGFNNDVRIAIFSLNSRPTIKRSLQLAEIEDQVDFYIGREDVKHWKPEPEGLLKIQNYFNVDAKKMIFFGDSDKDLLAGQKAGIDTYYIDDLIKEIRHKMK